MTQENMMSIEASLREEPDTWELEDLRLTHVSGIVINAVLGQPQLCFPLKPEGLWSERKQRDFHQAFAAWKDTQDAKRQNEELMVPRLGPARASRDDYEYVEEDDDDEMSEADYESIQQQVEAQRRWRKERETAETKRVALWILAAATVFGLSFSIAFFAQQIF